MLEIKSTVEGEHIIFYVMNGSGAVVLSSGEKVNSENLLKLARERLVEAGVVKGWVEVNNVMQKGYIYPLTMPHGDFSDYPMFKPDLTPAEMLDLGVFGGKYFNDVADTDEYPRWWWMTAKLCGQDNKANAKLNYYGVKSGDNLGQWRDNHWMSYYDPRGWFEWYCRFYMGRRTTDDERQIKRWKAYTRHLSTLKRLSTGPLDGKGLKTKQSLLHWAYDARKLAYYSNQ